MSRHVGKSTALMAATAITMALGVTSAVADNHNPPPSPRAVAQCAGTAEVAPGLLTPANPKDFAWELETRCEVTFDTQDTATADLVVSGTANGACGQSIADDGSGTLSEVDASKAEEDLWHIELTNIQWVSVGSILAVTFDHNGGGEGQGAAQVQASPLPSAAACLAEPGATNFNVTIVAETA